MVEEKGVGVDSQNYPSPSVAGEEKLRRAISDMSSLISLSHAIRVFPVKWQLIRTKLEELNSALIAAENCHSGESQPLSDLIAAVSSTVSGCLDLAGRCINVSYSGKLLMQSDLDLAISKLDTHIKQLSAIYAAVGILSNRFALVVSKPGVGATRDDMRFYIKDLLTRLKIGDCEMKRQALASLNEIVGNDERYIKVIVDLELSDLVTLLANFLDSNDAVIREEAAISVAAIAGFEAEAYRGVLVSSGVIAPLIRVVETGSLRAKVYTIRSLEKLTQNGDNAWALSAHGGVTALLNLCKCPKEDESCVELIGPSCWVLKNLVGVDEITRFMIEQGAIPAFIKLLKGKDEIAQIGSAEFLQSLASGDEHVRHLIVKEGGARALVRILDPKSVSSFKSRETAFRAIENLCFESVDYVNLLISYGFLEQLLYFLRKGDISIQELAFKSASKLCGTSEDARKSMGDAGFMPEFIKFLEAKSYEIREMAAQALSAMVMVPKNRKKFTREDHNIRLILQLLDLKEGNSGNFKFLLSILMSISSCNHARRKITHSGYVNNIEKLADAGISDAKKIVRKLSANRFKSMLNGIWH